MEEALRKEGEAATLKDQLQELRFASEKLQKTEILLEKNKKRAESVPDMKKKIKSLEETVAQKDRELQEIQQDRRKDGLVKQLLESYKEKQATLEAKNSALEIDKESLEMQIQELQERLVSLETEKQEYADQLELLSRKFADLECQDKDTSGLLQITLDKDVPGSENANEKIDELVQENQRLSDQLLMTENQLDDLTRLKEAFEQVL